MASIPEHTHVLHFPDGTVNLRGQRCAHPPKQVHEILRRLQAASVVVKIGGGAPRVAADDINSDDLAVLNTFASEVAGKLDCKIRAIFGCASCSLDFEKEKLEQLKRESKKP